MEHERPSVAVEVMQPADALRAAAAIEAVEGDHRGKTPSETSVQAFLARPDTTLLVAWAGDDPAGFLVAYRMERMDGGAPMMCLYEIGVARPLRGRGVGTALLRHLGAVARGDGVGEIWAVTHGSNAPARRLFEGTGASADPGGDSVVYVWESPESLDGPPRHRTRPP